MSNPNSYNPDTDYIRLVHNHIVNFAWTFEEAGPANNRTHTAILTIGGTEARRYSASSKKRAQKVAAYAYLRDNNYITTRDAALDQLV